MRSPFQHRTRTYHIYQRPGRPTWYFKLAGRELSLQTPNRDQAIANARLRLQQHERDADGYAEFIAQTHKRTATTCATILDDWLAAGCPESNGTVRTHDQQADQLESLTASRAFFDPLPAIAIKGPTLADFARWRRARVKRKGQTGTRSVDRALVAMSNAFDWAVAEGRVDRNPFLKRPRFHTTVTSCPAYMPASDEELHRLTGAMMTSPDPWNVVTGAQLLFCALTGLRPGEPAFLRLDAAHDGDKRQPGLIYTARPDGLPVERLAIQRSKHGINPAVTIHPALRSFLDGWLPTVRTRWPGSPWYFPNPDQPERPLGLASVVRKRLNAAAKALRLPERHPHAMRAFYVRVRRSQDADALRISIELGQGSGARMVERIYGEAHDAQGDGLFDWLPSPESGVPCAWTLLNAPTNTVLNAAIA